MLLMVFIQLCIPYIVADNFEDVFVSVDSMRQIIEVERHIVSQMEQLKANLSLAGSLIDKYLLEFQQLPNHVEAEKLAKDPLFTFQLMRRIGMDLNPILTEVLNIPLPATDTPLILPDYNGVVVSATHLVQLQSLYNLSIDEMLEGRIKHYPAYTKLKAEDVVFLAKSQNFSLFKGQAQKWTKAAYDVVWKDLKTDRTWMPLKIHYLQELLNLDEEIEREGKRPKSDTSEDKSNLTTKDEKSQMKKTNKVKPMYTPKKTPFHSNYMKLCKGETDKTPADEKDLKCSLTTRNQPYLILKPVKMERLSRKPNILLFHELLTPKEVEHIQNVSRFKLYRSTVSVDRVFSQGRSSKTAWMKDSYDPIFVKMTQTVRLLTGLDVREHVSAEEYQVVNYGLGGQYYSHYDMTINKPEQRDSKMNNTSDNGGRLATFMFYLSNVEEGGYTVFPKAGVISKPIQGSAVLWYNLLPSGLTDDLTFHGGCPVLYGSKWISNKWIYYKGQMKTKPCGFSETEWPSY